VALSGQGFLTVKTSGGTLLTRGGHLTVDGQGRLATHEGYPLVGVDGKEIHLPPGADRIRIDSAGKVFSGEKMVGQISISFPAGGLESLTKVGNGLFFSPDGLVKGEAVVRDGGVEGSNVKGTSEMVRMIQGMRTYQTDLQALHTLNDLTNRTVNDMTVIA
jgi:Flagellar basal body rod protein